MWEHYYKEEEEAGSACHGAGFLSTQILSKFYLPFQGGASIVVHIYLLS